MCTNSLPKPVGRAEEPRGPYRLPFRDGHFGQALEAVSDPVLIQQGMPHMQALSIQLLCLLVVTLVVESSGEIPELVADAILIPQILKYGQALLEERDRTGVFALLALDLTQVAQGPAYTVEIALLPV